MATGSEVHHPPGPPNTHLRNCVPLLLSRHSHQPGSRWSTVHRMAVAPGRWTRPSPLIRQWVPSSSRDFSLTAAKRQGARHGGLSWEPPPGCLSATTMEQVPQSSAGSGQCLPPSAHAPHPVDQSPGHSNSEWHLSLGHMSLVITGGRYFEEQRQGLSPSPLGRKLCGSGVDKGSSHFDPGPKLLSSI